ncbi:MAG: signal transduction histidine kinase [Comamonadaceae bacterium]|nr:MAG: signal transduction histidine kinase [Comamonadaceae bacterium]
MTDTTLTDLARTELFKDVPDDVLRQVLLRSAAQTLAAGDILLSPEKANQHVYLLLSGTLSLRFDSPTSPEVRVLPAGVAVGEMSTIDDTPPSAYVIAKESCVVLPIHRKLLAQLVAQSHPVALNLLHLMGQWVKANTRHIANDQTQIQRLSATLRHVTAQGLDQRIPSKPEDRDFAELIAVFNEMLERLERSFKQASRFSGDAAHELKTPLAILQGQIEQLIGAAEVGSPTQIQFSNILDEVRRLSSISQKLLLLSQADAGRIRLHLMPCDFSTVLRELMEDACMLGAHLRVSHNIAPRLRVVADADLMLQTLHNLLSNAIKYNLDGGWIHFHASCSGAWVELRITNASENLTADQRAQLFERFYRVDPARNRAVEGSGLGLSLAREIARAHGGELHLEDSAPGETRFCLTLPAPPPTDD